MSGQGDYERVTIPLESWEQNRRYISHLRRFVEQLEAHVERMEHLQENTPTE